MAKIEKEFEHAMFAIYQRAKDEAKYTATIFLTMLNERGGIQTARYLVNATKPSDGYTNLWTRGRLDLTVEAMIIDTPKWHPLFTADELKRAEKRLAEYGYKRT